MYLKVSSNLQSPPELYYSIFTHLDLLGHVTVNPIFLSETSLSLSWPCAPGKLSKLLTASSWALDLLSLTTSSVPIYGPPYLEEGAPKGPILGPFLFCGYALYFVQAHCSNDHLYIENLGADLSCKPMLPNTSSALLADCMSMGLRLNLAQTKPPLPPCLFFSLAVITLITVHHSPRHRDTLQSLGIILDSLLSLASTSESSQFCNLRCTPPPLSAH